MAWAKVWRDTASDIESDPIYTRTVRISGGFMATPDFYELLDNKGVLSFLAGAGGWFLKQAWDAIRSKTKRIQYTVAHNRIALSADDPVFGSVRVMWQGNEMRVLYTSHVRIENSSFKDFTNVSFTIFCGEGNQLLGERTGITGTGQIVEWSDQFRRDMTVPTGQSPTQAQIDRFRRERQYSISVLNRGQVLEFNYLVSVDRADRNPVLVVDMLYPGVSLEFQVMQQLVHGVPVSVALKLGLLLCFVVVGLSSYFVAEAWVAGLLCVIVGLFAQSLGAMVFKAFDWLRLLLYR
jgi:hypothetical protein